MGEAELDLHKKQIIIYSNIITYGNAAAPELTEQIRDEIETMWNEPGGSFALRRNLFVRDAPADGIDGSIKFGAAVVCQRFAQSVPG